MAHNNGEIHFTAPDAAAVRSLGMAHRANPMAGLGAGLAPMPGVMDAWRNHQSLGNMRGTTYKPADGIPGLPDFRVERPQIVQDNLLELLNLKRGDII